VLLQKLDLEGPYVLVGHSLGGLNAEVFAGRYPDEVAGMILLDPPPLAWLLREEYTELLHMAEQMTREWQETADRGIDSADPRERREALFFQMLASEHREMLDRSARLAADIETFGETPVVVVASGVPNPLFGSVADGYQEYWIDQSRAVAARSRQGQFILAEDSTHRLHEEAADLVLESTLSMVDEVRAHQ
jgi:pimeloyl-ACP methyl ester carboxylesterase